MTLKYLQRPTVGLPDFFPSIKGASTVIPAHSRSVGRSNQLCQSSKIINKDPTCDSPLTPTLHLPTQKHTQRPAPANLSTQIHRNYKNTKPLFFPLKINPPNLPCAQSIITSAQARHYADYFINMLLQWCA